MKMLNGSRGMIKDSVRTAGEANLTEASADVHARNRANYIRNLCSCPSPNRYLCSNTYINLVEGQVIVGGRHVQNVRREVGWNFILTIAEGQWRGWPIHGYISHVNADDPNSTYRKFFRALGLSEYVNPCMLDVNDLLHRRILVVTSNKITTAGLLSVAVSFEHWGEDGYLEVGEPSTLQEQFVFMKTPRPTLQSLLIQREMAQSRSTP